MLTWIDWLMIAGYFALLGGVVVFTMMRQKIQSGEGLKKFGVKLTQRGNVETPEGPDHYRTNVDKVFTAGDMHRGQSLVVWNIVEGRGCAREVDEYLMGYTALREQ